MKRTLRILGPALALALFAHPGAAKELSGVTMPDTTTVGGKALKLNGMGMRKKSIFKVYVGGLYLEAPSKDAAAIIALDAPKAVKMHFVRDIGRDKLVEGFKEGFEANAKDKLVSQKAAIDKFLGMASDVKDGEEWTFAYDPAKGTTVWHGDREVGTIEGKEFAQALFSLWLGPKPPTEDLKKGMLG
jgi:hypothetical protein